MSGKRICLMIALICLSSSYSMAQGIPRPDENTGPQGCDWEAVIDNIQQQPAPTLMLKLVKVAGACVMAPCPSGKPGDLVMATTDKDKADQYRIGQTIHVWVNGSSVNLKHPPC